MSIRESVLCRDRLSNTFYQHIPSCLHHALSTCTAVSVILWYSNRLVWPTFFSRRCSGGHWWSIGETVWRNWQPPRDQVVVPLMSVKKYNSQRVLCFSLYTLESTAKLSIVCDVHILDTRNWITALHESNLLKNRSRHGHRVHDADGPTCSHTRHIICRGIDEIRRDSTW